MRAVVPALLALVMGSTALSAAESGWRSMSLPPAAEQLNRAAESAESATEAAKFYAAALQSCPTNGPALFGLGRIYLEQNQPADSLELFRRLDRLFPDDPVVLGAMAAALARWPQARRADIAEGVRLAERATQLAPASPPAWHTLSVLHLANGDIPAAANAASKAIKLQQNLPADPVTITIYTQQELLCNELLALFSPLD